MCGRYVSVSRAQELREYYKATGAGDGTELAPSHNVAPTNKVYAVVERGRGDGAGAERQVRAVRWGLVPAWWKPGTDPTTGKQKTMPSLHNARADRVAAAPSWRGPFAKRREAIPAAGYYEWLPTEDAGGKPVKQPYYIHPAGGCCQATVRDICHDGVMAYEFDEQAQQEAAEHPLSEDEAGRLSGQCARKTAELGLAGVHADTVRFYAGAWDNPPGLPASIPRTGRITRNDVLHIGDQVRERKLSATDLFAASFVWGWGSTGFGPRRYRDIRAAAGDRLEPTLQRALAEINKNPGSPDPIAGYAQLYGGYDYQTRAAPGQEPWSRLRGFGPAFFTKFLYFSTPGALILDNRLANAVYNRSGIPHLVTTTGQSLAWTPYRYAVYLHWMKQTARTVNVEPDLLELTLFRPPKTSAMSTMQPTDARDRIPFLTKHE